MDASLTELPVTRLKGVGPKLQQKLAGLGISSVADLLFHLPFRYQDRTQITPIAAMQAEQDCVIEGEIRLSDITYGKRRSLICKLQDHSGVTSLRFFHFSAYQKARLEPGKRIRCFGVPRRGPSGLEMFHPEYQLVDDEQLPVEQALTPIYPSTEGIHQAGWRKLSEAALALLNPLSLPDLLPASTGPSLVDSLRYLHQPPVDADLAALVAGIHPCQQRLASEELVAHHLSLLQLRRRAKAQLAPAIKQRKGQQTALLKLTGFQPTGAQQRVAAEIATDMAEHHPMLRLLQGDVGSGKTLVAAMAAVQSIAAGYQVAIMAPTEILAEQHLTSFTQWLGPMGYTVAWLAGKQTAARRREQLALVAGGEASLIV
jgi:ATP-dependent DNA helicase RecG